MKIDPFIIKHTCNSDIYVDSFELRWSQFEHIADKCSLIQTGVDVCDFQSILHLRIPWGIYNKSTFENKFCSEWKSAFSITWSKLHFHSVV